jgi:Amt family ammonium transporter
MGAICCRYAGELKHMVGIDDALDVFNVHGIGGLVGTLLTGILAEQDIVNLDGLNHTEIKGGWVNGHWAQIGYQLIATIAGGFWSFFVTFIILWLMNKIPGLELRVDEATARAGLDRKEIGESAYQRVSPGPEDNH